MKRIRYKVQMDGTYQSINEFFTPQGNLCVQLNPFTQAFTIFNTSQGNVAFTGTASPALIKKAAKQALISLGVQFEDESRKRA